MKIVLASGIYPPDVGGPATYSQLIAREFSKRDIDVEVICYSDKSEQQTTSNEQFKVVRILRGHARPSRYFLYFWNLLRIASSADVIYAQGPLGAGLPAMWVSRILGKKFVVKIVGDYAWEQYYNQETRNKRQETIDLIEKFQDKKYDSWTELRRLVQKIVCKSVDKIIVPSEFLKKIVTGWGIDENKIKVVYNAFTGIKDIKSKKLNGDIIISAGRPEPWKGFSVLKEIIPELKKENPKFKLIIANRMPHDELMGYLKASRMFVLNSGYEGFSHMILEVLALGLPVITTNVCGNPEIIKDNYNGLLVEYNNKKQLKDAILKLWKDRNLQKKFIINGKKTLEKFKLETMINKTLEVLKT